MSLALGYQCLCWKVGTEKMGTICVYRNIKYNLMNFNLYTILKIIHIIEWLTINHTSYWYGMHIININIKIFNRGG
jgi:hypothetical protein